MKTKSYGDNSREEEGPKMTILFPENDRSYMRLRKRLGRRSGGVANPHTLELYWVGVKDLAGFLDVEPGDPLLKYLKGLEKREATATVDEWIDDMTSRHSSSTVTSYLSGVKKWLKANRVRVEWSDIEPVRKVAKIRDKAPPKRVLRRLMVAADPRERVVITVLSSSGLRASAFLALKVENVDFDYDEEVACIRVPPGTEGLKSMKETGYYTFITPEAKQHLLNYLEQRRSQGEEVGPNSPLIRSKRPDLSTTNHIDYNSLQRVWNRLLKRAGYTEKSHGVNIYHLHTLRKYFRTFCGLDESVRERLMGHKGEYLDASYFRPPDKTLLQAYREAIPNLTVMEVKSSLLDELEEAVSLGPESPEFKRVQNLYRQFLGLKETQTNGGQKERGDMFWGSVES